MTTLFQGSNAVFIAIFLLVGVALLVRKVPLNSWGGPFVSIGILGTFWGILQALLGFDPNEIDKSVPALIDGMKTAFATSVVGVTVSVATRLIHLLQPASESNGAPTAQDYIATMRAQTAALEAIKAGIGGESDSSLLVQVQKLRLDMQDFMKKLSTQSTDAIIDALKEVIRDFNSKINEQFGENFKQLNEAVGRLVGWMEVHQQLVTKSHAQLTDAIVAMDHASKVISVAGQSLAGVARDVERIRTNLDETARATATLPPTLSEVRAALERITGDAGTLSANVDTLGVAVGSLTTANVALASAMEHWTALAKEVPEASASIQGMVASVRTHSDAVTEQQRQLIVVLRGQIETLAHDLTTAQQALIAGLRDGATAEMQTLGDGLRTSQAELLKDLSTSQKVLLLGLRKDLNGELQALSAGLRTSQGELLTQLRTALIESGNRNQEAVDKQIKALDDALGRELSTALQLLGGKLGSLSQQFVSDYGPLTQRLTEVVHLSKSIDLERRAGGRNV